MNKIILDIEVSHVFRYNRYTKRQRIIMWFIYLLRNILDILSGILGIISLGLLQTYWSSTISEIILRYQMKFYKEIS